MSDTEYNKILKQYHKLSDRHILVVETDMPYSDVLKVVALSEKIRKAGNELVGLMRKNHDQLLRTKRYRRLLSLYGNTENKVKRKLLANQLKEMQESYNITWNYCRTSMIPIGRKYGIDAVFALTKAEDIWRGIEKCLYDNIPHSNLRPTKSLGVPGTGSADIAGFMGFHKKRLRQEASSFL